MKKLLIVGLLAVAGCGIFRGSGGGSVSQDENGNAIYRIAGTVAVDIPAGVSDSQALDAVELAINGTSPGERNNSWVSKWRPELRDPENRWIRIGLNVRQHYLCVCYRIEGNKLIPDVPTSRNLNQKGTSIHRKVPAWINNFSNLVQMQMYGLANGSNCIGTKASTKKRKMEAEARTAEAEAVKAEAQAAEAEDHAEKAVGTAFCSHCGAKVSKVANFCSSCGKKIKVCAAGACGR